jgi:hypothetical protein
VELIAIDEAPAASAYRFRARQVVALVVIAVCALLALWGTPRQASSAAFATALHEGQVTGWDYGSDTKYGAERTVVFEVHWGGTQPTTSVVWSDTSGRLYRSDLTTVMTLPNPGGDAVLDPFVNPSASEMFGDAITVDVPRTMAANAPAGSGLGVEGLGWAGKLGWPLTLVMVAAFFLLILSPQPRRRTKWATFWYLLIPLGLGLVWAVVRDAPWSEEMNATPEPPPRWRGTLRPGLVRSGGGQAWWVSWVASLVVGMVVAALLWVVPGWTARHDPPQGSTTWKVVWANGSTGSYNE